MKRICLLLVFLLAVQRLPAQTSGNFHVSTAKDSTVTYAPLFLSVTGMGRVFPFQDGQMLRVGRKYAMIAIPDRGYVFTNWQAVNVFTDIAYFTNDVSGVSSNVNTVVVPIPAYIQNPLLKFTMLPTDVLYDGPGGTLTMSIGWQANFVPGSRSGFDRGRWR